MEQHRTAIPYYSEINDFLASLSIPERTENPIFYCHRLDRQVSIYRPPFKRAFYLFALFINHGKVKISYDNQTVQDPEAYLVFHSPGLIYSFSFDNSLEGYLFYFKKESFDFFKPDIHKEFPFFNLLHTNLYKLDRITFAMLEPFFREVFDVYRRRNHNKHIEARIRMLALLYHMKEMIVDVNDAARFATPQQMLFNKYLQLVNNHYIDKRTVNEYAAMLAVTPNHLSSSVKSVSGRNALSFISERLHGEAKSLLLYTDLDIAEITYQLGFTDPANFGKFFKKLEGFSPSEFRRSYNR